MTYYTTLITTTAVRLGLRTHSDEEEVVSR